MSVLNYEHLCGWKYNPREIEKVQTLQPYPTLKLACPVFGLKAKRETTLLHKFLIDWLGYFNLRNQGIGDCASMGNCCGVDHLKGVQHTLLGTNESWVGETCTEFNYGTSRCEVGQFQLRGQEGSYGSWCAEALKRYGSLARGVYGKYDLRTYSAALAQRWGDNGVPDDLEPIARQHIVKTIARVTSVEETIAAITNGYPVTLGCNYGFSEVRDANGFAEPAGSWAHMQCIVAYRTDIEGFLVINSWGKWNRGPKVLYQPDGSYWIRAAVLDDIYSSRGTDNWALSNFEGYPPQKLDLGWF